MSVNLRYVQEKGQFIIEYIEKLHYTRTKKLGGFKFLKYSNNPSSLNIGHICLYLKGQSNLIFILSFVFTLVSGIAGWNPSTIPFGIIFFLFKTQILIKKIFQNKNKDWEKHRRRCYLLYLEQAQQQQQQQQQQ
jgi:hypothetical protein